jgi:hypothetical protein
MPSPEHGGVAVAQSRNGGDCSGDVGDSDVAEDSAEQQYIDRQGGSEGRQLACVTAGNGEVRSEVAQVSFGLSGQNGISFDDLAHDVGRPGVVREGGSEVSGFAGTQ